MNSCVYVIADGAGFCKIGASVAGNLRVREIHSPASLSRWSVACTPRHELAYDIEAACHRRLGDRQFASRADARIRGETEWFRISVDDALDVVADLWSQKTGTACVWKWDDTKWGWRPRMSVPDFASKKRHKK